MPPPSPFSPDQESQIVLQYGKLQSIAMVRRWFRLHYQVNPHQVPNRKQFHRIIERFKRTNTTSQAKASGRPVSARNEDNVERIHELITDDKTLSIRQGAADRVKNTRYENRRGSILHAITKRR